MRVVAALDYQQRAGQGIQPGFGRTLLQERSPGGGSGFCMAICGGRSGSGSEPP